MTIGTNFNRCFLAQGGHGIPGSTAGTSERGLFVFWMNSGFHYLLQKKLFVHHMEELFIVFEFFHFVE